MIDKSVYEEAVSFLSARTGGLRPDNAVILGSGLGNVSDQMTHICTVPFTQIPGFAPPYAPGHAGNLIFCRQGDSVTAVMQGRYHFYEGRSHEEVVFPVRVLWLMGARVLIATNASGGINSDFSPGDLMIIDDHIKFAPESPLRGENRDIFGTTFPDMTQAYDSGLKELAFSCARELGIQLKRGVYMYMTGPQFETPAEIRAIRLLGGDCVGMSTVPEVIAAVHMGMKVLGISLITNAAAGITGSKLTHEEVIKAGDEAKGRFSGLIMKILEGLDSGNAL